MNPLSFTEVSLTPELLILSGDHKVASELRLACSDAGLTVRQLRGCKTRTMQGLFDEVSAALQFPSYFGENWAAFDECLADMDWLLPTQGFVLIVLDAEQVLADSAADLSILVSLFEKARDEYSRPVADGEWWDREPVPFHVILQADGVQLITAQDRWQSAGAVLSPLAN